ncbi:MAG: endonuclease III [Gemmatimonadaceae bacterium]
MTHGPSGQRAKKLRAGIRRPRRNKSRTRRPRYATPERALEILQRLMAQYPDARCSLTHETPFQLLIATILSAQCTDARVNIVTPELFARYRTVQSLADANQGDVEELIKSTGFFRNKARSIIGMANAVLDRHGSEVPGSMDELTALPGVGRKTANVLLGNAFGRNDGIVVDTHVARLSQRLGLTKELDPVRIEEALVLLFPKERWTVLSHLFIDHGRAVCVARSPRCRVCVLSDICPSSSV